MNNNLVDTIKYTYVNQLISLNYNTSYKYPNTWNKNEFIRAIKNIDTTNKNIIVDQYIEAIITGLNLNELEQNAYKNALEDLRRYTNINVIELEDVLHQYLTTNPDANCISVLNNKGLISNLEGLFNGGFSSNDSYDYPIISNVRPSPTSVPEALSVVKSSAISAREANENLNQKILDHSRINEELANKLKNANEAKRKAAELNTNLERELIVKKEEVTNLEDELGRLRSKKNSDTAKIARLEGELAGLLSNITNKEAEVARLQADLARLNADTTKDAEVARLQTELNRLLADTTKDDAIARLQAELTRLNADTTKDDAIANLNADLARLRADTSKDNEIARLQAELTRLNADTTKDDAIARLQVELTRLNADTTKDNEIARLNGLLTGLTTESSNKDTRITSLQSELDKLKVDKTKDIEITRLQDKLDNLRDENARLTTALNEVTTAKTTADNQIQELNSALVKANADLEQARLAKTEADRLTERAKLLARNMINLKKEADTARASADTARASAEAARDSAIADKTATKELFEKASSKNLQLVIKNKILSRKLNEIIAQLTAALATKNSALESHQKATDEVQRLTALLATKDPKIADIENRLAQALEAQRVAEQHAVLAEQQLATLRQEHDRTVAEKRDIDQQLKNISTELDELRRQLAIEEGLRKKCERDLALAIGSKNEELDRAKLANTSLKTAIRVAEATIKAEEDAKNAALAKAGIEEASKNAALQKVAEEVAAKNAALARVAEIDAAKNAADAAKNLADAAKNLADADKNAAVAQLEQLQREISGIRNAADEERQKNIALTAQLLQHAEDRAKKVNAFDSESDSDVTPEENARIQSIITNARSNINSDKSRAVAQGKINKEEFKQFLLSDFTDDQQIHILKTIISQLQIKLEPSDKFRWFIRNYLNKNPITIKSDGRSPEVIIKDASDFWKEPDGYIFDWKNYLNKEHQFNIPPNTKDHSFMSMVVEGKYKVDHKFLVEFLLFFIDYINEEADITDAQLIQINANIKSSLRKYGLSTVDKIINFYTRFINYVISNKTNTGIIPLQETVLPPGYDRLLTLINKLQWRNRLNLILGTPKTTEFEPALRQYLQLSDEDYNKSLPNIYNINGNKDNNKIKEDLDAMRAQVKQGQRGGNLDSNKLLYNVVTTYIMCYNSKNVLTIKDIVKSSLQSSLVYKNGKIRNFKIPTINDIFKMIVLPIMCSNKGVNVTYENMLKCFNKKMHKLISNKDVEKYIELFDLTAENKITLREYDRRVASIKKLLE